MKIFKVSYWLLSVFLVVVVDACITVRCPGFDVEDKKYISYRVGDKLTYKSDDGNVLTLKITKCYHQEPYAFTTHYPDNICNEDAGYETDTIRFFSIKDQFSSSYSVQFGENDTGKKVASL